LADAVEAILGAAYLSVGFPGVYIATQSFTIPVLEYDATLEIGRKMLPEPPAEVSHLLKSNIVQTLEGIIGHKFRRKYYLAQVLVSGSAPSSPIRYLCSTLSPNRRTKGYLSIKVQAANGSVSLAMVYWTSVSGHFATYGRFVTIVFQ